MKKKVLAILLAATILLISIVGCNSKPAQSAAVEGSSPAEKAKGEITLEFWTINLKKNFSEYIQGMIDVYESKNPNIKINWVDVPGADVTKKMVTALAGGKVPNVINETTFGFASIKSMDALAPINEYASKEELDRYIDGMRNSLTVDGKLLAIPWYHEGAYVQYINKEIYDKAGLDSANPPKNFDELLKNGRIIHEKLPGVYGSNDFPSLLSMQSEGLQILSTDKKTAVFNTPEHVKFVQKFVDGYKDGAIAPGAIGKDDRSFQQSFDSEQVGQWGWWYAKDINNWKKNTPTILKKVVVAPPVHGAKGEIPAKGIQLFLVPKKAENVKESVDFLLFITNPENQLQFCKLAPIFPSTKETMKDKFFQNIEGDDLTAQARRIMISRVDDLVIDEVASLDNSMQYTDSYNEQVRAAMAGTKTVQEALDQAVKEWNALLAK